MNEPRSRLFGREGPEAVRLIFVACLFFFAGVLLPSRFFHAEAAKAGSQRVYELMVYHALPNQAPALETIFKNVSSLQTKHGLNALGYWIP